MSISTWITLIAVLGIVWGGFLAALGLALSKEKKKVLEGGKELRR